MRGIKAEDVLPFLSEGEVISIVELAKRMRDAGRSGAENSVRAVVLRDKRFFVDRTTQRFKVSLAKEGKDDGTMRIHTPWGDTYVYDVTEAAKQRTKDAKLRRHASQTADRPGVEELLENDSPWPKDEEGDVQISGQGKNGVPPVVGAARH